MLFNLPDDIINEVLRTWLNTVEVCKLDSANCDSLQRKSLLLKLDGIDECSPPHCGNILPYLQWTFKKGIRVRSLTVNNPSLIVPNEEGVYPIRFQYLREIEFISWFDATNEHCKYINNCISLKRLKVSTTEILEKVNDRILRNLEILVFTHPLMIAPVFNAMARIRDICHNLEELCYLTLFSDPAMMNDIVANNGKTLKNLASIANDFIYEAIANNCVALNAVDLWLDNFTLAQMIDVFKQCPTMKNFHCFNSTIFKSINLKMNQEVVLEKVSNEDMDCLISMGAVNTISCYVSEYPNLLIQQSYATLTEISLENCSVDSSDIQELLLNCTALHKLILKERYDDILINDEIIHAFKNTKYLRLLHCIIQNWI